MKITVVLLALMVTLTHTDKPIDLDKPEIPVNNVDLAPAPSSKVYFKSLFLFS